MVRELALRGRRERDASDPFLAEHVQKAVLGVVLDGHSHRCRSGSRAVVVSGSGLRRGKRPAAKRLLASHQLGPARWSPATPAEARQAPTDRAGLTPRRPRLGEHHFGIEEPRPGACRTTRSATAGLRAPWSYPCCGWCILLLFHLSIADSTAPGTPYQLARQLRSGSSPRGRPRKRATARRGLEGIPRNRPCGLRPCSRTGGSASRDWPSTGCHESAPGGFAVRRDRRLPHRRRAAVDSARGPPEGGRGRRNGDGDVRRLIRAE